jgi:hypothetical protein
MMVDYSLLPTDEEQPSDGIVLKKARAKLSAGGTLSNNVTASQGAALPNSIAALRGRAADLYQQGSDMFNADPDMTALQDFAKQRGAQGNSAMLNALAAQFAGERFQPIQEQMLKKAQAASDPMKVGGGMITADGQYIKDPVAAQDKKAEFLLSQAKMYEQMATNAETRAEAQAYRERQDAVMNEIRAMNAQTARMSMQNSAGNSAQSNARGNAQIEDRMADDWDKAVKNDKIITNAFDNLKSTPQSAAGDVSFIYQYMKMLDPGSVVREGEFATAQNATGVPERIANMYNRAMRGERLNPRQRQEFLATAQELANVANRRIENVRGNMTDKAKRRGLDINNIILNNGGGGGGGASPSDPLNLRR